VKWTLWCLSCPYIFGAIAQAHSEWNGRNFWSASSALPSSGFSERGHDDDKRARQSGEAGVGALERGVHGERYPIGDDENHNYRLMLEWMKEGLGINKAYSGRSRPALRFRREPNRKKGREGRKQAGR
jgi:hypothetical protein